MAIFVRRWLPAVQSPRAAVLVAHGAAEHSQRYGRLARALNAAGYVAYAPDHRGHGQTAGALDQAGWAGPDGWNGMLDDMHQLAGVIQEEHPGLPLFLFGHSMGSMLSQAYMERWGAELRGVILSGSTGALAGLDQALPLVDATAQGEAERQPSAIFGQMFAGFNEPFVPARTGFEWLSRDEAEVQKYVDDPWCGFAFSNRLVADFMNGLAATWRSENEARIPKDLPMLIFSGALDPVGGNTEGVKELARRYAKLGIRDVEVVFYPEARHETLNETNRDQVQADIVAWLDRHVTR
jgi:alpha-beta hydrolase superfamily lysophospholipase